MSLSQNKITKHSWAAYPWILPLRHANFGREKSLSGY
jgi:hypothetical protein